MSRRLPNCAFCGMPLKKAKAQLRITWEELPGAPEIGWCDACDLGTKDPEFLKLKPNPDGPSDGRMIGPVLAAIEARGPDRVRRGR
jgi:hypothetical protein